jgi:outer membrane receptor for ferrienterochelin and colicin
MRLRHFAVLLAVLLIALPVAAQEQSGSIDGVVKDAQGAPVAGATVVAKSARGLTVETVTDTTGTYRFPSVPPGRYEITASLTGFAPGKVDASVVLGSTASASITLKVGGVTETIQVTAEAPLIDVKSSARATNLRDEAIDKMPKGRDYTSLISQAPGVNPEYKLGGISIDGSSGGENRYIVDGAEITNLQSGTGSRTNLTTMPAQSMMMPTDFLDEVQIKSSGYSAEFGGSTGGVVNVITKSGSNSWRGDVMAYYSGDSLNGDERPSLRLKPTNSREAEYVTYAKDSFNRIEPGFTLGGPLVRDKVWFFAGYNPTFRPLDRTVTFRSDNTARTTSQDFTAHYAVANVTAQLSPKTRAKAAFRFAPSTQEGVLAALDGSSSPTANFGITTKRPTWSGGVSLDFTPSNRFYTSVRGAYYYSDSYDEGVFQGTRYLFQTSNVGQAGVPANLQQVTNFASVPTNTESSADKQKRLALQWDATLFAHAGGEHQVKFGVQLDRIQNEVLSGETGNLVRLYWDRQLVGSDPSSRGAFGYYQVRSNGVKPELGFITEGDVSVNNLGLFIQDTWTISNRFTLNLGLRTEDERVPNFDPALPQTGIKYSFADKLAPRVGFAWDIQGDGKTKAYASWGIFYDITKLEMPRGSFGGDKWLEYYYSLDTADWPNLDRSGCPPACPGRLLRGPIDFRHPSTDENGGIDPDIKPMRSQERSVGIERQLTNVVSVGARYVHKQFDRVVEDIGALDAQQNEIYTIGNPGEGLTEIAFVLNGRTINLPKAKRDYDAVELSLNKRMSNRWSAHFSYLWSRLYGNHTGLSQGDENGRTSPNVGRNYDVTYMMFDQTGNATFGVLPTDRTHQLKAQFVYDAKFGTSFGLNWFAASGVPKTRELAAIPPNNYPVQYLGRGSDGRMPFTNQIDLNVQHEFKLSDKMRFTLIANVLNLLDSKTATNFFAAQGAAGQGLSITEQQFYSGSVNFQQAFTQQNLVQDPRFLQEGYCSAASTLIAGCGYQDPRTVRLGVKLSF